VSDLERQVKDRAIDIYIDAERDVAKLKAEIERLRARVAEWQPIETAPQDGRTLLLGYFNSHGKWRTMRGQWMSADFIADNWEEPENGEPGWHETSVEADQCPTCWFTTPTHWMPLPAAPAQTKG